MLPERPQRREELSTALPAGQLRRPPSFSPLPPSLPLASPHPFASRASRPPGGRLKSKKHWSATAAGPTHPDNLRLSLCTCKPLHVLLYSFVCQDRRLSSFLPASTPAFTMPLYTVHGNVTPFALVVAWAFLPLLSADPPAFLRLPAPASLVDCLPGLSDAPQGRRPQALRRPPHREGTSVQRLRCIP